VVTPTDVVVTGPGHDIVVADVVNSFDHHIAAVPHHVVMCLIVINLSQWVVHRRAVCLDTQTRRAAAAVFGKDSVAAAVARMTLNRRSTGAEFRAAQSRRSVELDCRKARTLDHHLADLTTLLLQHLTLTNIISYLFGNIIIVIITR